VVATVCSASSGVGNANASMVSLDGAIG
jgi:hypothetical protein